MVEIREESKALWARVDELLENRTVSAMCRDLGLNYQTIKGSRNKGTMPRPETLDRMAGYLGVSVQFLRYGRNSHDVSVEAQFVDGNPMMEELVRICMDNPRLVPNILAMARIAKGMQAEA